jgi:hypothetical protein
MGRKTSMERRDFLKTTAVGAAGLSLGPGITKALGATATGPTTPSTLNKWPGRVVINFNKNSIKTTGSGGVDAATVKTMMEESIMKLTDKTTLAEAWLAIFPEGALTATTKIAIKVNTLNSGLPAPCWQSVKAITDGLQLMQVGGAAFPASNISIYEMNSSGLSSAGYTTANFPGISIGTDTAVDGGDGALNNRTYASKLKAATFLINVFSPRGHSFPSAGSQFTLGFKSHYGTYSNPSGIHSNWDSNFRELVCTGPVYKKLVLSVCSGIFGMNEGNGPIGKEDSYTTYVKSIDSAATVKGPATIMMSTDPIAIEMQTIKMMRINQAGKYTKDDMPGYLKASGGMTVTGLTPAYNIGTIDEAQMNIRKIINSGGVTPIHEPTSSSPGIASVGLRAHQINGHGSVFLEFKLPSDHVGNPATIEIFNAQGSRVMVFSQKVLGVVNQLSWDKRSSQGVMMSKGMYVARLSSGALQESARFSIIG